MEDIFQIQWFTGSRRIPSLDIHQSLLSRLRDQSTACNRPLSLQGGPPLPIGEG